MGQAPRARLLFGLAHALDGRGEFLRAAECARQANAMTLELAQSGVTVNAVCPGWVDTPMVARAAERIQKLTGRTEAEARQALSGMHPIGRFVRADEVAEVCFFLASEQAAAITGATYVIDGGELA